MAPSCKLCVGDATRASRLHDTSGLGTESQEAAAPAVEKFGLGVVSRILCAGLRRATVISLRFLAKSAFLSPATRAPEGATYPGLLDGPSSPLFCLAPDWVFPAAGIAAGAVGSYPTFSPLPCRSEGEGESERVSPLTFPFHSHPPQGGMFSVALSVTAA